MPPTRPTLYSTEHRAERPLATLRDGEVRIYTCGPTVYNHAHIGNLRTFLFEDVLRRALRFLGYRVVQVMNLTDIDDKTIAKAAELGITLEEYTQPFIDSFFRDLDTLKIERVEEYPKATEHVAEMIALVERLIENGYAYRRDGSVFFRIAADEDYGRLSRIDLDQVRQGDRVADDDYGKDDARDFVLWKEAKPGEPFWESPWGRGRPGWHIECSAMSMKYLGERFDVHCGGVDNIFPHHENEIAQSESATGKPFVGHWVHAEHLIVDGEKMSKSLGNQYTLSDLLEKGAKPRAIRYLLLSVHYRKKLNFTFEGLQDAEAALARLDEMRFRLRHAVSAPAGAPVPPGREHEENGPGVLANAADALREGFAAALAEDLNLSKALAELFDFVKTVNVAIESGEVGEQDRERVEAVLAEVDTVLAVLDPAAWADEAAGPKGPTDDEIEALLRERLEARQNKDFARADEIRNTLADQGIVIEDTPQGPRWKRR